MPSLAQLDQAVREFIAENPADNVTVVVDASFGHRIDPSEVATFEAAEAAGEVVSPPAGAIGRGDAFLLRIAEKTGATVLSNDSFQEFHGEHTWLFEKGRLIGGKPVPGVGWIFMDRTPVRGAKSREVTKEAKRKKRSEAEPTPAASGSGDSKRAAASEPKVRGRPKAVDRAIARATEEVVEPAAGTKSRRRRGNAPPAEAVNEPLAFITFIAAHPLGSEVVGAVLEYSSHGAFVEADGARCYVPLSAMGEPPPRRAREVVFKGESRSFVVQAFDPQRRGIELALPGFAKVAGGPTAETVEAEIAPEPEADDEVAAKPRKPARKAASVRKAVPAATKDAPEPPAPEPAPAKKAAVKKAVAKTPVKRVAAPKKAPAVKKAPAAKKAPSAAPAVKKAAAKKTTAPAAAPAVKAPAPTKASAPAKTPSPAKAPAPVKAAAKKAVAVKKAPAVKAPAPAKKAAPKKAPAKSPAARKAPPAG